METQTNDNEDEEELRKQKEDADQQMLDAAMYAMINATMGS